VNEYGIDVFCETDLCNGNVVQPMLFEDDYDEELNNRPIDGYSSSENESTDIFDSSLFDVEEVEAGLDSRQSNQSGIPDFSSEIRNWALKYNIRHSALNELLIILSRNHNVPKDSWTLL